MQISLTLGHKQNFLSSLSLISQFILKKDWLIKEDRKTNKITPYFHFPLFWRGFYSLYPSPYGTTPE